MTLKDHKSDFHCNPACRLINPTKTQMGKISELILHDICATFRIVLDINQWRNTNDCIRLFKDHDKNDKCSFIKFDIKEFYASLKNC